MNEEALKIVIGQAISNIIANTKSEYASLNEIYEEVARLQNKPNEEILQSQIRARLQECCPQYDAYLGKDDFFRTKEKYSGLWKNNITGEPELTPYIKNLIKQYPGIDTIMLKSKLYEIVNLTPGDRAISLTRAGEMKIDQIMRNFVSHKESHKDILFDNKDGLYKMYYVGNDEEINDVNLYEKVTQEEVVKDIIAEENETPEEEEIGKIKLSFITDELIPKESSKKNGKIFIRKNDLQTWIKREKSRVKNGNIAEGLVYAAEKQKLLDLNREDLAEKVKWISRDSGDGYGYDILSYEVDSNNNINELHIEVKSTANLTDDFIMSSNELRYARENRKNYRLYRVAKVKSKSPICKVIEVDLDSIFKFEPSEFKVSIKGDE